MGCNIHLIVEVKKDGKWKPNKKKIFPNPQYDAKEKLKPKDEQLSWVLNPFINSPNNERNYGWFAILADVNNYNNLNPISEPRGIPEDATNKWLKMCELWQGDMHSHSYLHVSDFNNFDWNQETIEKVNIPLKTFEEVKDTRSKPSWTGWNDGSEIIIIEEAVANKILNGEDIILTRRDASGKIIKSKPASMWSVYVEYHRSVSYSEWFEHKIKDTVEPLRKLAEEYEDVRLVFGFDN